MTSLTHEELVEALQRAIDRIRWLQDCERDNAAVEDLL